MHRRPVAWTLRLARCERKQTTDIGPDIGAIRPGFAGICDEAPLPGDGSRARSVGRLDPTMCVAPMATLTNLAYKQATRDKSDLRCAGFLHVLLYEVVTISTGSAPRAGPNQAKVALCLTHGTGHHKMEPSRSPGSWG